jgi:ABC-2 type transport system permease protein
MNWWRFVIASEIRKIMAFRSDFWVTFLGQTIIQILIARALWASIFESSGNEVMEGYTLEMMTLYYLIVPIGQKMLTGENVGFLSREIYDGTFNRYLIYPISFFQYKTLTYLTHSFFYGLQMILIFIGYHFVMNSLSFDIMVNLAFGFSIFLIASFAYLSLALVVELISLWADNIWTLMVMMRFFCFFFGGAYVPLNFFPPSVEEFLNLTPFPYLISLPLRSMMGLASSSEISTGVVVLILWAGLFRLASKLLWDKGQYRYSGVGI